MKVLPYALVTVEELDRRKSSQDEDIDHIEFSMGRETAGRGGGGGDGSGSSSFAQLRTASEPTYPQKTVVGDHPFAVSVGGESVTAVHACRRCVWVISCHKSCLRMCLSLSCMRTVAKAFRCHTYLTTVSRGR